MMDQQSCSIKPKKGIQIKLCKVVDGYTLKYHANGITLWSKGKMIDEKPDGYWEWYRIDGTLKRSGHFHLGQPVGQWITYDHQGQPYLVTNKQKR